MFPFFQFPNGRQSHNCAPCELDETSLAVGLALSCELKFIFRHLFSISRTLSQPDTLRQHTNAAPAVRKLPPGTDRLQTGEQRGGPFAAVAKGLPSWPELRSGAGQRLPVAWPGRSKSTVMNALSDGARVSQQGSELVSQWVRETLVAPLAPAGAELRAEVRRMSVFHIETLKRASNVGGSGEEVSSFALANWRLLDFAKIKAHAQSVASISTFPPYFKLLPNLFLKLKLFPSKNWPQQATTDHIWTANSRSSAASRPVAHLRPARAAEERPKKAFAA